MLYTLCPFTLLKLKPNLKEYRRPLLFVGLLFLAKWNVEKTVNIIRGKNFTPDVLRFLATAASKVFKFLITLIDIFCLVFYSYFAGKKNYYIFAVSTVL